MSRCNHSSLIKCIAICVVTQLASFGIPPELWQSQWSLKPTKRCETQSIKHQFHTCRTLVLRQLLIPDIPTSFSCIPKYHSIGGSLKLWTLAQAYPLTGPIQFYSFKQWIFDCDKNHTRSIVGRQLNTHYYLIINIIILQLTIVSLIFQWKEVTCQAVPPLYHCLTLRTVGSLYLDMLYMK